MNEPLKTVKQELAGSGSLAEAVRRLTKEGDVSEVAWIFGADAGEDSPELDLGAELKQIVEDK